MSVHPRWSSCCSIATVTPNAGRMTTSVALKLVEAFPFVGEKADAHGAQLLVDVRVVDDLAGQKHLAVGKPFARLVCVVDRAVDAVAEAEFAREVHREPVRAEREVLCLDALDDALW